MNRIPKGWFPYKHGLVASTSSGCRKAFRLTANCLTPTMDYAGSTVNTVSFLRDPQQRDPLPIPFPYTSRDSYGSSMGMGVPLLRVPGISLD